MGEHELAMGFDSIRMSRDSNNNLVLTTNATKDTLKAAPQWNWPDAKEVTTGAGFPPFNRCVQPHASSASTCEAVPWQAGPLEPVHACAVVGSTPVPLASGAVPTWAASFALLCLRCKWSALGVLCLSG